MVNRTNSWIKMPWNSDKYKNPRDYEEKTAEKVKGKATINSGATFGDMDVQSDTLIIDNKRTQGKGFRLDYRDFKKVANKANEDQIPAMFINYDLYEESLVVIKESDLLGLLNDNQD